MFNFSHKISVVDESAPVRTANIVNMYCQLQGSKLLKIEQFLDGEALDTPCGIYLKDDFAPETLASLIETLEDIAPQHFKLDGDVELVSLIMYLHYIRLAVPELSI